MSNTYSQICIHLVFSTKYRNPVLNHEIESKLTEYMRQYAYEHEMLMLAAGGSNDHLHILLIIPPKISVSDAARLIKGSSSKWLNDHIFKENTFRWQRGYGAFSINKSMIKTTIRYIQNQREHHKSISYQNELVKILEKHEIDYDNSSL